MGGRKTVTRRVVKFKDGQNPKWTGYAPDGDVLYGSNNIPAAKAPYKHGDILYVRETWCDPTGAAEIMGYMYKADCPMIFDPEDPDGVVFEKDFAWRPSIHMPKEAARIFLRVTNVRVERLHDMTATSAMDEGFTDWTDFVKTWNSTIKYKKIHLYGWDANPWVWVIEFERISEEETMKGCE